ncbi:MAG: sialidase family protein [Planctomycetia bacterium]|jgi:hypothetical protein
MRYCLAPVIVLVALLSTVHAEKQAPKFEARKIWDKAGHNAFTDLIRWNGKFYCAFRESSGHIPKDHANDGKIRVLVSEDGKKWESVALLAKDKADLRDAKLSITPDGRLMALMGGSFYSYGKKRELIKRIGQVAFMSDPKEGFGPVRPIVIDKKVWTNIDWLWRVTWKDGVGYGVVYEPNKKKKTRGLYLVKTTDGIHYELVKTFDRPWGWVGEATVRFAPDGEMFILVRCETGQDHGFFGHAKAPYTGEWTWKRVDMRLGGPNFVRLPDGTWLMGTRYHRTKKKRDTATVLARIHDNGHAERLVTFPSDGDTSYPGMVIYDNKLWVSYYSSHEKKASIYFAVVPLDQLMKPQER